MFTVKLSMEYVVFTVFHGIWANLTDGKLKAAVLVL
jgi:hypothetical protein